MWAVPHWLCEALLRMDYRRDASVAPSKESPPGCPVSTWSTEQAIRRKRQLRMSVEGDREDSDDEENKKKRQEHRRVKSCCSEESPIVGEGDKVKVKNGSWEEINGSYELERHCRLAFGPALGTRNMTHWRAANGIVSHTGVHTIQPEEPKELEEVDDSEELTATERFETLYKSGELIGEGGYGRVYAGHRKSDNLPVALKMVDMKKIKMWAKISEFDDPIPLEIALLRQVCHSPACTGIAEVLDYMALPGLFVIVLERPEPCQDLFHYMQEGQGYLEEREAKHMLQQLVRVLLHCHSRGVVHRDLKPENVLVELTTLRIKLLDFGSASVLKEGQYTDVAGTPEYLPPETVLRGEYFAIPATVWSLGILLFQMVWGDVPFYDEAGIVKGTLYFPRGISRECRHLIRQCLAVNPKDRPTLEQILVHPWML